MHTNQPNGSIKLSCWTAITSKVIRKYQKFPYIPHLVKYTTRTNLFVCVKTEALHCNEREKQASAWHEIGVYFSVE